MDDPDLAAMLSDLDDCLNTLDTNYDPPVPGYLDSGRGHSTKCDAVTTYPAASVPNSDCSSCKTGPLAEDTIQQICLEPVMSAARSKEFHLLATTTCTTDTKSGPAVTYDLNVKISELHANSNTDLGNNYHAMTIQRQDAEIEESSVQSEEEYDKYKDLYSKYTGNICHVIHSQKSDFVYTSKTRLTLNSSYVSYLCNILLEDLEYEVHVLELPTYTGICMYKTCGSILKL